MSVFRKMYIVIFLFLFSDFNIYNCSPVQETVNEENWDIVVETSNGKVGGSLRKSQILDMTYFAFQSIPYAEPPVGVRRFKEPNAIANWTGILNATKIPKACPQPVVAQSELSEDCLFLNIFIPSSKTTTPLPVIFWVHGGFFVIGNGRMSDNLPDLLINEEVILVSINYRLGIFGFLSAEDDILPGNYAIKDQIEALKWVHKNIAHFGGDPSKITLMGQSAGAASVGLLLQTPSTQGIFSAAILQSGNSLNLWSRTKNPKSVSKKIAEFFKIEYDNSQQLLDELQKLSWADLLSGFNSIFLNDVLTSNPVNGLPFGPTTEPYINGVVSEESHEKLRNGDFNRVPVLTGFNSAEANTFIIIFDELPLYLNLYDIMPSRLAPIDLNADSSKLNEIGGEVKNFYFGSKSLTSSKQLFVNFVSDDEFIRPAHEFVRLLSGYSDTYFYRFSYEGQLPVVKSVYREIPGAIHGEELQYLFYSPNENAANDIDMIIRKRLVKLWTNFAKYHNPTPTVDPLLQNITWEPVLPDQINYLNIDTDLRMLKNPSERNITFWTTIYDNFGQPPFDTY